VHVPVICSPGDYDADHNLQVPGGSYYGSLYKPTHRGSKGGNGQYTQGGNGGGYIKLEVTGLCICLYESNLKHNWFNTTFKGQSFRPLKQDTNIGKTDYNFYILF